MLNTEISKINSAICTKNYLKLALEQHEELEGRDEVYLSIKASLKLLEVKYPQTEYLDYNKRILSKEQKELYNSGVLFV